jgi:hypothetical protein
MRVSDVFWLKWLDFENDRLYNAMGKNLKAAPLKALEKPFDLGAVLAR